jgi:thiol-disulfide isomerase/thioredoxin
MQKRIIPFISFLILLGCASSKELNTIVFSEQINQDILFGNGNREVLEKEPFITWYENEYKDYNVDVETLDEITFDELKNVTFQVILGTWCPDSRREVPRFYKIMDHLNFSEEKITLIGVNRNKKAPLKNYQNLQIEKVPTFIIYKNQKEIGRIVESPLKSLEKDLLNIIINPAY